MAGPLVFPFHCANYVSLTLILIEVVVITVGLSDLLHGLILCKHSLQTV